MQTTYRELQEISLPSMARGCAAWAMFGSLPMGFYLNANLTKLTAPNWKS
jgi:hypothetical protein